MASSKNREGRFWFLLDSMFSRWRSGKEEKRGVHPKSTVAITPLSFQEERYHRDHKLWIIF